MPDFFHGEVPQECGPGDFACWAGSYFDSTLKACNQLHYLHLFSRRAVLERENELDPAAFRLEPCQGLG